MEDDHPHFVHSFSVPADMERIAQVILIGVHVAIRNFYILLCFHIFNFSDLPRKNWYANIFHRKSFK